MRNGFFLISIHALLAESDASFAELCKTNFPFLSTLSLRRATLRRSASIWLDKYFYPRSPCGERLATVGLNLVGQIFLSTLSLRRATAFRSPRIALMVDFYPRSPCGERPYVFAAGNKAGAFLSTLSLRRATSYSQHVIRPSGYFYPRSPCGERLGVYEQEHSYAISIHALLAESDRV